MVAKPCPYKLLQFNRLDDLRDSLELLFYPFDGLEKLQERYLDMIGTEIALTIIKRDNAKLERALDIGNYPIN